MEILNENFFDESSYFTTWGTVISDTFNPKMKLSNNSLRQIVHVSASGNNIRLKLSNKEGKTNLEIKEINIADSKSQGFGEIDANTIAYLTFKGEKEIIIPPEQEIYTDTISYNLKPLSEISISIYFGLTPDILTGHKSSRTHSFIEEGNKISAQKFSKNHKKACWYFISAIEVSSLPIKKTIVCFGDSITDGSGSTIDKQNRWIDLLANKLYLNKDTSDIAVVNKGLSGCKITNIGLQIFLNDVLQVKGVTYIIVLIGVNDINSNNMSSIQIISAYKQIIEEAHKNNLFIYGGTVLPYGNCKKWNKEREIVRQEVNNWIKNTKSENGGFDAIFDFDKLIKDPNDETKIFKKYDRGDGLHLSPEGHKKMVESIDNLELFTQNFIKI